MKKYSLFCALIISLLLISCNPQYSKTNGKNAGPLPREEPSKEVQAVKEDNIKDIGLKTDDNVRIKATFYKGSKDMPSIILLHMLHRNRHDWDKFAEMLQNNGYNTISIDSRDHGESDLKWNSFSEKDFNNMVLDAKAAKDFLINDGIGDKIAIIGASIGANTALNFAAQDDSIKTIILLSPGLDYRGVKTEESILKFKDPVLIIVSDGDSYAAESSRKLNSLSKNSTLKIYNGSEHGTSMIGKTDIDKVMVEWLGKI